MKTWSVSQWFKPLNEGQQVHIKGTTFRAASRSYPVEVTPMADGKYMVRAHRNGLNDKPYLLVVVDSIDEVGSAVVMAITDERMAGC